MATMEMIHRPAASADYSRPSRYRTAGFLLGFMGLGLALATLVANVIAAGGIGENPDNVRETLAWSFGVTTTAFAMLKFGIATVLMGVLIRAWMRVEATKVALPQLKADGAAFPTSDYRSPFGAATATDTAPPPLMIHRIAPKAWGPAVAMGLMLVMAGLVLSFIRVGETDLSVGGTFSDLGAWVQGLQFLGEAMLLGGITFLLGSILGTLRNGGGEVQESMGLTVKTLKMPLSAKLFMALMMVGIAQFVLYIVATGVDDPAAWYAWLGPFRELSLGLLLMSIVLALYTIGTVLGFQFNRMREIVTEGS